MYYYEERCLGARSERLFLNEKERKDSRFSPFSFVFFFDARAQSNFFISHEEREKRAMSLHSISLWWIVSTQTTTLTTTTTTTKRRRRRRQRKYIISTQNTLKIMSGLACLKKSQTEDEDAQELKLGPDFSDAQCLSISEVRLVMEAMIYDYNNRNEDASSTNTQVFEKTLKYVQRFGGNVSQEAVQLIRDMLTKQNGLHTFEAAVVSNLRPVDYDEAKTLVPSLEAEGRASEEQIQRMLDEMANVRRFE